MLGAADGSWASDSRATHLEGAKLPNDHTERPAVGVMCGACMSGSYNGSRDGGKSVFRLSAEGRRKTGSRTKLRNLHVGGFGDVLASNVLWRHPSDGSGRGCAFGVAEHLVKWRQGDISRLQVARGPSAGHL